MFCYPTELPNIEKILFSCEWLEDPNISPFSIVVGNKVYNYKCEKIKDKYYIVTC